MKIIDNNPYRVLGVYSNSRRQEIIANNSKASAFIKVHKAVAFPLDLPGVLPTLSRTLDMMNEAEAHLAIAKEQIKYSQFWFLKISPLDDIAFNHLIAGNITNSMEIWLKQESLSSLQNRLVCYLIENNIGHALELAEKLYEKFGNEYVNSVDPTSIQKMTGTELFHQFIDTLGNEVGMQKLVGYELEDKTKAYINSHFIGPLISKISSEVERAKHIDHKDPEARKEAGQYLMKETEEPLKQLRDILPDTDSQYQMIADKLGLEILQCGIDYFNNTDGDNRYMEAMAIQKFALSVVVGTLAKQRCQENVDILQKQIDRLPPEQVKSEHDNLQRFIAMFVLCPTDVNGILNFIKDTCGDLIRIKEKLGKRSKFYVQQTTLVAQIALSKSIEVINELQEKEYPKLDDHFKRNSAIETLKHAYTVSWETMLWIELMDTTPDFRRERLEPNKKALKGILDQVEAFDSPTFLYGSVFRGCAKDVKVDPYTYYTEGEMYAMCINIPNCRAYINKYPNGAHLKDVKEKLAQLKDDERFVSACTLSEYKDYLSIYPRGRHADEAKAQIKRLEENEKRECLRRIESCTTIDMCTKILGKCNKYPDVLMKLDDKFFSLCKASEDYKSYLGHFGTAAQHISEAEQCLKRKKQKNIIFATTTIILLVLCLFFIIKCDMDNRAQKEELNRMEQESRYKQLMDSLDSKMGIIFLADYPNCDNIKKESVIKMVNAGIKEEADLLLSEEDNLEDLNDFLHTYDNFATRYLQGNADVERVKERVKEIKMENERKAEEERIQKEREEEAARQREEYEKYGTDAKAWNTASTLGTLDAYKDYLSRYPKGKHASDADKKIIDLEVQEVVGSGDFGHLPPSQKTSFGRGNNNSVYIKNSSSSTITVLYSGAQSKRIVLSPKTSKTVNLPSGRYQVVATASGVTPFYGTENLTGGSYESEYYIRTTRY